MTKLFRLLLLYRDWASSGREDLVARGRDIGVLLGRWGMWLLTADGRRRMRWMDVAEATCTGLGESSGTKDVRSLLKDKCKEPDHRGPQLRSDSTVSPPSLTRPDEAWASLLFCLLFHNTRSHGVSWKPRLQLLYLSLICPCSLP